MVSLVLVSHSLELAEAVKALADQQTQGNAQIAAVGGTGDPDQPFGTDATAILAAIQSVYSTDGVVVLMDLGSAVLSTETALEFLEPDQRSHVRLSSGPFVEGALAAAVQASIGMDLPSVAREAAEALGPKAESMGELQVSEQIPGAQAPGVEAEPSETEAATVTLTNAAGLHFRPAARFVQSAATHPSAITVRNLTTGTGPADAKRFNQVLGLGAEQGHTIEIRCEGQDAEQALASLLHLVEEGFGETEAQGAPPAPERTPVEGRGRAVLYGTPASPGVAAGTAFHLGGHLPDGGKPAGETPYRGPEAEWAGYLAARDRAAAELSALAARMGEELGAEHAGIFEAQGLMLQDPDLADPVRSAIETGRRPAAEAVDTATAALAARYEAMEGERFQARAADVRDLRARLLRILGGDSAAAPDLPENAVIVADDLMPSETAGLDRRRVAAIVTARGGPTSHSAILARSLGIPAVTGLGAEALQALVHGQLLAVDGSAGSIIVEPDPDTVARFAARRDEETRARAALLETAHNVARTRDGHRVEVMANLVAASEAGAAREAGAEGVGLLRTEFLFQDRLEPPTEEEQYAAYRQVAEAIAPDPVIIRTLDIGGDKPAPYLRLPAEQNPFLGWRAIRISLAMPELFKTQLRAILRAAASGNVRLMFPLVASLSEVRQARALLQEAARELDGSDLPHASEVPAGIMVEVPAVVEILDQILPWVDFLSIGTNDLAQYTFAADRGNPRVAGIADSFHPALLRQIARVAGAAERAGRPAGVCGEMAGLEEAIPILVGMGLGELSMTVDRIPAAKASLARLTLPKAQALAREAVGLEDAAAVRAAVRRTIDEYGL